MGINLDAESVRSELTEGGVEYHDLTPAQVTAICALNDDTIDTALDAAADELFWQMYDSVRRDAIAALAKAVATRTTFEYVVRIDAPTREQADHIMAERLNHDEDYGFPYTVGYDFETDEED